jgi:aminopeptidase N
MNFIKLWLIGMALQTYTADAIPRSKGAGLTKEYAAHRAKVLRNVKYELGFNLEPNVENYSGTATISFNMDSQKDDLTIDFAKGKITSAEVNGMPAKLKYDGAAIHLPRKLMTKGRNRVLIKFEQAYSKSGSGLYRFVDPEDKNNYLYSDFEPYDANQMFPCFDQPDLKASFELTVRTPKDWTVITSVLPQGTQASGETHLVWNFPESKLFSTYIFSLHAGPYHEWKDPTATIPSRLFARKSLAKFVKSEEWFQPTRQGMKYFQEYFGIPYPFAKYDQVIVPDFNSGAMENVAAVTFSERFVPRGPETIQDREDRAEVILHEMAHMWFGNLVTMKWWDDLWLNESFATFMAAKALVEATEYKSGWQSFYSDMKQWAYWEDQLVTTHPILASVPNTEAAFANFDGITYGKGAAVLKQLSRLLGEENFQKGVQQYLKTHSYENATLQNFIGALADASSVPLKTWSESWLQSAGLNTIGVDYQCDDKAKISKFTLKQSPSSVTKALRTHKTVIGAFGKDAAGNLVETASVPVTYSSSEAEVPEMIGKDCPMLVYPNYLDHDYVRVNLDPVSINSAKSSLSSFSDSFLRSMLWQSLWDMTRDAQLPIADYADVAFNQLARETDPRIVSSVMNNLHGEWPSSNSVAGYFPRTAPQEIKSYEEFRLRLESFAFKQLSQAAPAGDMQRIWFESWVKSTYSGAEQTKLIATLEGQPPVKSMDIDQDLRWLTIRQLSMLGHSRAEDLISKEQGRDPSNRGKQAALAAQALLPSLENKKKWFDLVSTDKPSISLAEQKSIMWNLFPTSQRAVIKNFKDEYFKRLNKLSSKREVQFVETYASSFAPAFCDPSSVSQLDREIKAGPGKTSAIIYRELRIAHQEDERCLRITEVARKAMSQSPEKRM